MNTRYWGAALLLAVAVMLSLAKSAVANDYPNRPIRLIVPHAVGGITDLLARSIAKELSERLKQPVIVENRGGGGSVIGTQLVASATPDGYTLLVVASDFLINPTLRGRMPYDTEKDFSPITLVALSNPVLVVESSLPIRSVQELADYAKSRPGVLSYGSGGNGTVTHLAMELVKSVAKVDMVHIPYSGLGPAVTGLLGGQVKVMFVQMPLVRAHVQSKRLRVLAALGAKRSPLLPEVPTLTEEGLTGAEVDASFGLVAPRATPKEVIGRLNREIGRILDMPEVRNRFASAGTELVSSTPGEFEFHIHTGIRKWAEVVKKSGARLD